MAKKINKIEEFYILNNPDNLSTAKLAKELGVTPQTIKNIQKKNNPEPEQTSPPPTNNQLVENSVAPSRFDSAIGKVKREKSTTYKNLVGTVMTPAAAEIADEDRKKSRPSIRESLKNSIAPTRKPK